MTNEELLIEDLEKALRLIERVSSFAKQTNNIKLENAASLADTGIYDALEALADIGGQYMTNESIEELAQKLLDELRTSGLKIGIKKNFSLMVAMAQLSKKLQEGSK